MKILAIFPHPDDSHLNAGGTLARWITEGHCVVSVCCTAGGLGTLSGEISSAQLAAQRTAELRAADAVLGIAVTEMLGFPDGEGMDFSSLRRELVRCVRRHAPDRVLTLDPWARYEIHPDHTLVGRAAAEAATFACFPLLYPDQIAEGLSPCQPSEIWFMGQLGDTPNTFVNIEPWLNQKTEALLHFEATLATLDVLMSTSKSPRSFVATEELKQRTRHWISELACRTGKSAGLNAAEAFIVQRCAPGHFDNYWEQQGPRLGEERPAPRIIR